MIWPWRSLEQFLDKIRIAGSGCWEWIGSCSTGGYGHFWIDGVCCSTHRLGYELWRGPIPYGLTIDHLCRNRRCLNPDHLEAVTHTVNVRRGLATGPQPKRDRCYRGHLFTSENTRLSPDGAQHCKLCAADRQRDKLRARAVNFCGCGCGEQTRFQYKRGHNNYVVEAR
jgi:hypothetical protein